MKFVLETDTDDMDEITNALEHALGLVKEGYMSGFEPSWYIETELKTEIVIELQKEDFLIVVDAAESIGERDGNINECRLGFESICAFELLNFLTTQQIKDLATEKASSVLFVLID